MSTLTSLVKSGKRKISKTQTGVTTTTKTALGLPDLGVSHDPMRPQKDALKGERRTALGRPDLGVSHDPMRPQEDALSSSTKTALGLPDLGVSHDPMRPQENTLHSA